MKRLITAAVMAACTLLVGISSTFAQDGPPQFRPVEMWVCNFNNGKDQGDMDKVYEDIVAEAGDSAYSAFQLNSYFRVNQEFDFIYLGAWADGSTMGASLGGEMAGDSDAGEGWEETVTCPASLMYASTWINQPGTGDGSGDFVLSIADCNVAHGNSNAQALGALRRYSDYAKANGSDVGTVVWFPAFGGGATEFDFKVANVYSDAQHFGDSMQWFTENQAYIARSNMTEGIVSCDSPRVYGGRTIMNNLQPN